MDPDQTIAEDGSFQPSCMFLPSLYFGSMHAYIHVVPYWKARFGAECVSAVVQGTLTSRAPKYSIILSLDRKVRDMDMPLYAQQVASGSPGQESEGGLGETMSRFMPVNYRELSEYFRYYLTCKR